MSFERLHQPLLAQRAFARRLSRSVVLATFLLLGSLAMGTGGYHWLADLGWTDAFLNASMILTGMGPVSPLPNATAKVFASLYALWSGIVFIAGIGVVVAPLFHRFLHRLHLDEQDDASPRTGRRRDKRD